MTRMAILLGLVFWVGCAMPSTVVKTPDTRPSLAVSGAPDGSLLYVDGAQVGDANRYDGQPNVLMLEPGTHLVVVKTQGGEVVYQEKVYVESELKTIKVH